MRLLTTLQDESAARTLGDALYAQGMPTSVKTTRDGEFAVWVHEENHLQEAQSFLSSYNPEDARMATLAQQAREQRRQEARSVKELQQRAEKMRRQLEARQQMRIGRVTLILMILSGMVFFATDFGQKTNIVQLLTFTPFKIAGNRVGFATGLGPTLAEPWRLLTPIFLHFGFLHILFNMWWLKDLGSAIERVFSPLYLLLLVVAIGVGSNFLEWKMSGPTMFGGMSGVVYGLFAFIWVRGRFDRGFPYRVPSQIVTIMLLWLGLGFTGLIGHIANWVHLGGLLGGALWGFLSSGQLGRGRKG